jgi:hypothetical protein
MKNSLEQFEQTVAELRFGYIDLAAAVRDIGITIDNLVSVAAEAGITIGPDEIAGEVSQKIRQQDLYLCEPCDEEPANTEWSIYDKTTRQHFIRPGDPTNMNHAEAIELAQTLRRIDVAELATRIMTK